MRWDDIAALIDEENAYLLEELDRHDVRSRELRHNIRKRNLRDDIYRNMLSSELLGVIADELARGLVAYSQRHPDNAAYKELVYEMYTSAAAKGECRRRVHWQMRLAEFYLMVPASISTQPRIRTSTSTPTLPAIPEEHSPRTIEIIKKFSREAREAWVEEMTAACETALSSRDYDLAIEVAKKIVSSPYAGYLRKPLIYSLAHSQCPETPRMKKSGKS